MCGVDISDPAIDLTRRRFALLGLDGDFCRVDSPPLPFADSSFDIVCSIGVLHHFPDPAPVVDELRRVLRPGGKIIVMLYHRNSFRYYVTFRWRQRFGPPRYRGKPLQQIVNMNDGPDCPWAQVYSRDETRRLLDGFVDHEILVSKLGIDELALWSPKAKKIISRVLPSRAIPWLAVRYGWNLYCTAVKPGP